MVIKRPRGLESVPRQLPSWTCRTRWRREAVRWLPRRPPVVTPRASVAARLSGAVPSGCVPARRRRDGGRLSRSPARALIRRVALSEVRRCRLRLGTCRRRHLSSRRRRRACASTSAETLRASMSSDSLQVLRGRPGEGGCQAFDAVTPRTPSCNRFAYDAVGPTGACLLETVRTQSETRSAGRRGTEPSRASRELCVGTARSARPRIAPVMTAAALVVAHEHVLSVGFHHASGRRGLPLVPERCCVLRRRRCRPGDRSAAARPYREYITSSRPSPRSCAEYWTRSLGWLRIHQAVVIKSHARHWRWSDGLQASQNAGSAGNERDGPAAAFATARGVTLNRCCRRLRRCFCNATGAPRPNRFVLHAPVGGRLPDDR